MLSLIGSGGFFKTLGIFQVSKLYNNNWVGVCIYIYKYILGNYSFHLADRLGCFFKVPSETARSLREKFLLLRLQIYTTWGDRVFMSRCAVENHRLSSSVAEFTSVVWKYVYIYTYVLCDAVYIVYTSVSSYDFDVHFDRRGGSL